MRITATFVKASFGAAKFFGASHFSVHATASVALEAEACAACISSTLEAALLFHDLAALCHITAAFFHLTNLDIARLASGCSATNQTAVNFRFSSLSKRKKCEKSKGRGKQKLDLFHERPPIQVSSVRELHSGFYEKNIKVILNSLITLLVLVDCVGLKEVGIYSVK